MDNNKQERAPRWYDYLLLVAVAALAVIAFAGCAHNIGTAFSGKVLNLGYDPELNKVGIQYYDGVLITGLNRENSSDELNFTDTLKNADKGETTSTFKYKHQTGKQISGYYVEALEAGAKAEDLDKYTSQ